MVLLKMEEILIFVVFMLRPKVKYQTNSIGICLIGGKSLTGEPDCNFTLAQFRALNELLVELQSQYDKVLVIGHRDVSDTSCPNFEISELGKFV